MISCTNCTTQQPRDMAHPRTFVCAVCGKKFYYSIYKTVDGKYNVRIINLGRPPLPVGMKKKQVAVTERPDVLKKLNVMPQQVWDAGVMSILTIDNSNDV